jgi:hypothetical protein
MPLLKPRLLYVSATDFSAPYTSITTALRQAAAGDTVLVGPGHYGPSPTKEGFPLYIPPGVTLAGTGSGERIIAGEGTMTLSFRPLSPEQSLVLLGDGSTLSGFTITGSGGNGIGTQPGARVLIVRNEIRQHGQHGILVSGPQEAIIKDNRFLDNGTLQFRPDTPRPAAGRQGHHIFIQGKGGAANTILIADNTMRGAFADAIAMVIFFDEPDAVGMQVRILHNQIEQSERRGLTIAGSFGPSQTRVTVDIWHNIIRDVGTQAIAAQAARPLALQHIRNSILRLRISENECVNMAEGIALFGGFGPATDNVLDSLILGNRLTGVRRHAIRCIGGVGFGGYAAHRNHVRVLISRNDIAATGETPIFLQGGIAEGQEDVTGNTVVAQLIDNEAPMVAGQPPLLLNDGLPGNAASVEAPAPDHERVTPVIPYQA